jgi:hypothetical protein
MNEKTERFYASWAKWRALQNVRLSLVGLCAYVQVTGETKIGAGMLFDA